VEGLFSSKHKIACLVFCIIGRCYRISPTLSHTQSRSLRAVVFLLDGEGGRREAGSGRGRGRRVERSRMTKSAGSW
jgi:hypothetical protein